MYFRCFQSIKQSFFFVIDRIQSHNLYLATAQRKNDENFLLNKNVTTVVTVASSRAEVQLYNPALGLKQHVFILDLPSQRLSDYAKFARLVTGELKKQSILLNCSSDKHVLVEMVASYLITAKGATLEQCLQYLSHRFSRTSRPNQKQQQMLAKYFHMLKSQKARKRTKLAVLATEVSGEQQSIDDFFNTFVSACKPADQPVRLHRPYRVKQVKKSYSGTAQLKYKSITLSELC